MFLYYIFILQQANVQYSKSCFEYALDLRKVPPTRHLEYDLVRFNVVDNEFETISLSNNYIITGVTFVSPHDYRDYQGSTCHSALDV